MRNPLIPRASRVLVAPLVAAGVLAAMPSGAAAATSTSFDAGAAKLSVTLTGAGAGARISRGAGGAILVDGAAAGGATVTNTDTIAVTGELGLQQVVVDLSGGALAPGKTAETGTGAVSDIEITVDAGTGGEFPLGDEVRVIGSAAADTIRFAGKDVLLNGDGDADVTTTNVEALAAEGRGGADRILGGDATLPLRLDGGDGGDELAGGTAADTLEGGAGDDIESGNGDADTFKEGAAPNGADTLDGGGSPFDRIDYSQRTAGVRIDLDDVADDGAAGEADDVRDSFEYVAGGAGNDTIVASQSRFASFVMTGAGGNDAITGGDQFDDLSGGDGNDTLTGNGGSDDFRGGLGDDVQRGGDGADDFFESDAGTANGADDIGGGPGVDEVDATSRTTALKVTLGDDVANDGAAGEGDNVRSDVEDFSGGLAPDSIFGSAAANDLSGGGGASTDTIDGAGGDDTIYGRFGGDKLSGGAGADHVYGEEGDDRLDGGTEDDELRGGDGKDQLAGGTGADEVLGDRDDDTLTEPAAKDTGDVLTGGDGADTVSYNLRATPVTVSLDGAANDGNQVAPAENDDVSAERVIGSRSGDTLTGSDGADTLEGAGGEDTLDGRGGDDTLDGGAGGDQLTGGEGTDLATYATRISPLKVTVGGGADDGSTGEGDDVETENVLGGLAGDTLTGDAKDNKLDGAAGDDTLDGRDGADQMIGGDGTDTATYATRAVNVNVWIDGQANDGGEADRQADNVTTSVENLIGSNGPDGLTGSDGANVLTGGPGQDTLDGGAGPDVLDGQAGVDTASYADRTARLSVTIDDNATDGADADGDGMGEEGDKVTTTVENIVGGSGPDRLAGGAADNRIDGRGGDDLLYGGASLNGESDGRDTLAGGEGNDTVSYAGRANADPVVVTLDGTANDGKADGSEKDNVVPDVENLVGGHGDDDLTGSNRPNRLSGGPFGDDVLHGEGGDDVFDEADDPQAAFADHDEYFGGEGNDTADYSRRTRSVAVTLDDNANDGYPASGDDAAENDNVHGDVETVLGSAQADFLWGSPDADRLFGNGGSDRIYGRGGDDDLVGADGVDRIFGDNGNDKITGGPGNNVLTGGYGDDQFVEAPTWVGNDGYNGGPGRDTVDYSARNVSVTVDNDNVSGDDGEDADFNGTAEEKDRVNKDVEVLKGGAKRDRLTNTQDTPDTCAALYGGGGDDLLTGGDAREALFGGDGSDTLNAGDDRDWLIGGNGSDLENGGDDNDTFVQGLLGISCKSWTLFEIAGGDGADRINGDGGTDQVIYRRSANSGVKVSLDGATNDGVVGEGDNVKTEEILGGSGNDTLIGDDKDNRISGFHGDDHIEGRGGDDTMVEFFGTDTILGEGGDDEIYADDKDNADTIDGGLDSDSGRWDDGDTVASMEDRN